jgi:hypothetical protein
MLINFEMWQRQFFDGEVFQTNQLDLREPVAVA